MSQTRAAFAPRRCAAKKYPASATGRKKKMNSYELNSMRRCFLHDLPVEVEHSRGEGADGKIGGHLVVQRGTIGGRHRRSGGPGFHGVSEFGHGFGLHELAEIGD